LADKYLFYSSTDPVVKNSTFEYYPLLKQVFLSRAATDSKVSAMPLYMFDRSSKRYNVTEYQLIVVSNLFTNTLYLFKLFNLF